MKKFYLIALTVCLFFSLSIVTAATDNEQIYLQNGVTEATVWGKFSDEELDFLYNEELYTSKVDTSGRSIVKVYETFSIWSKCSLPVEEIVALAENKGQIKYIVLNDSNTNIRKSQDGKSISVILGDYSNAAYADDLKKMNSSVEIFGEKYKVLNVYCFDNLSSHSGFLTYFVTDKGVFVKFYENKASMGEWFSEADFVKYGTAYYKHITSYEYNYDEDGNMLYGGSCSFVEYVNDIYGTEKDYGEHGTNRQPQVNQSNIASQETQSDQNSSVAQSTHTEKDSFSVESQNSKTDKNADYSGDKKLLPVVIVITITVVILVSVFVIVTYRRKR